MYAAWGDELKNVCLLSQADYIELAYNICAKCIIEFGKKENLCW